MLAPRFPSRWPTAALASIGALAWAAACSDTPSDEGVAPGPDAAPMTPPDAGPTNPDSGAQADAGPTLDCAKDDDVDGMKKHLACTGLYDDFTTRAVAADVKAYRPAVEFWSDGAEKQRWVYLPPGAKIDVSNLDEWTYPAGIKLWKEFRLDGKRVETRLFEKTAAGAWRHTVYRWNEAETDAVRKEAGEKLPPTGTRTTTYEIPNTTQCNTCHDGRKEPVLAFDAVALGLSGAQGVTLATLSAEGRFSATPQATQLALPDDVGDGKAPAAIGWLHANCGSCHNSNSGAAAAFTKPKLLLKPSELLGDADGGAPPATVQSLSSYVSTVCVTSNRTDPDGGAPYLLIRGGQPSGSLVAILSGQRSAEGDEPSSSVQMPPLVTRRPDTKGHAALTAWIAQLPACP